MRKLETEAEFSLTRRHTVSYYYVNFNQNLIKTENNQKAGRILTHTETKRVCLTLYQTLIKNLEKPLTEAEFSFILKHTNTKIINRVCIFTYIYY